MPNVNPVFDAILNHLDFFGRLLACENTHAALQPLAGARRRIRPVENAPCTRSRQKGRGNLAAALFSSGTLELGHKPVTVLIHDKPGQCIGFTEHKAPGRRALKQPLSGAHGIGNALLDETRCVNALLLIETPDTHAQHGTRAIRTISEERSVKGAHAYRVARTGLAANLADRRVIHPRMAPQQTLFLAFFQYDIKHLFLLAAH